MKNTLAIPACLLLIFSLLLHGCNGEECLCEPVEFTEEFMIPEKDSISLDSLLTELMGPKPTLGLTDTTIRYTRFGVWDTTRTVTEIRKSSSGYVIDKLLLKKYTLLKTERSLPKVDHAPTYNGKQLLIPSTLIAFSSNLFSIPTRA